MRAALPPSFRPRAGRPAVVGHRGVRGVAPENTLSAIRVAAAEGADAIEIDVRPCASGEVVVFHDPELARLTGDPRKVSDVSLRELSTLRVDGEPIPTLEQVLALAAELNLGVNVEIKHDVPPGLRARQAFVGAVAAHTGRAMGALEIVISSFDPVLLASHKLRLPALCHAQLVHESTYHDWALLVAGAPQADGVHVERSLFVPARVAKFAQSAFANAWTVNDPEEAQRLAALGASALITDSPSAILRAFKGPARDRG